VHLKGQAKRTDRRYVILSACYRRGLGGVKQQQATGDCKISFMICCNYTDQVKTDEIGQTCGTHEYKIRSGFCWANLKKRNHSAELGVDLMILKCTSREKRRKGADWIDLAQDRDNWQAIVNTTMNIQVPHNAANIVSS